MGILACLNNIEIKLSVRIHVDLQKEDCNTYHNSVSYVAFRTLLTKACDSHAGGQGSNPGRDRTGSDSSTAKQLATGVNVTGPMEKIQYVCRTLTRKEVTTEHWF